MDIRESTKLSGPNPTGRVTPKIGLDGTGRTPSNRPFPITYGGLTAQERDVLEVVLR
jgi:hypothetical protein